jgi:hypothetical protein
VKGRAAAAAGGRGRKADAAAPPADTSILIQTAGGAGHDRLHCSALHGSHAWSLAASPSVVDRAAPEPPGRGLLQAGTNTRWTAWAPWMPYPRRIARR